MTAPDVAGNYNLTYYIRMVWGPSHNQQERVGEDTIVVAVNVAIEVECPAAPAIATELLRENGVTGRAFGRFVSAVAHEMGSHSEDENGSWFWGIDKCYNGVPNSAYAEAVDCFLQEIGAY